MRVCRAHRTAGMLRPSLQQQDASVEDGIPPRKPVGEASLYLQRFLSAVLDPGTSAAEELLAAATS